MIAFLRGEPGGDVVRSHLLDPGVKCYAHCVNLCEVYYDFIRRFDVRVAEQAINDLFKAGVVERADLDDAFWRQVGGHKARGGIALGDCFCLALAVRLGGQVVTSDRKEFEPLVPLNICPILFIR